MATYRLSFIFKAGNLGWSEQWYLVNSGRPQDVPGQILNPVFYGNFLAPRSQGVILDALRVNDADNPRNSFLAILNINAGDYQPPQAGTGEQPQVCALGYCVTQSGKHRQVQVRGLIDAAVARDNDDQVVWTAALNTALQQFTKQIIFSGFAVRVLQPPDAAGGNVDRQVLSLAPAQNDNGATTITYQGPQLFNGPVILHGVPRSQLPGYSGVLPGYGVTATTVNVPVFWRGPGPFVPGRTATIRNAVYKPDPVASIVFEDLRIKKAGRPIGSVRGRRSAVYYRSR